MELNDTLRVPLAPAVVRDALEDLALLRASFDHCESFAKLAHGEFALTITVPLGPLRARYDVRAHSAG
ncbi:carbon monoxide dehydrogenase, partial [Paraburkholderia sp. SIMBA_009]